HSVVNTEAFSLALLKYDDGILSALPTCPARLTYVCPHYFSGCILIKVMYAGGLFGKWGMDNTLLHIPICLCRLFISVIVYKMVNK
ncbi:hypothetical protein ACJX0J_014241, partial [Zea mays]